MRSLTLKVRVDGLLEILDDSPCGILAPVAVELVVAVDHDRGRPFSVLYIQQHHKRQVQGGGGSA